MLTKWNAPYLRCVQNWSIFHVIPKQIQSCRSCPLSNLLVIIKKKMIGPRLLLLSNSTQHGSGYLEYCQDYVKSFFTRFNVTKVLFIPYALKDHDAYAAKAKTAFQCMGLEIESIHEKPDVVQAVHESQGIFIGGGNTFLLLKSLYDKKLIEPIRHQVLVEHVPYMGASAGTNVSTTSICTTNDMPICYPPSFDALKLVPFNINPHYIEPDANKTHMGETRDQRIREYHQIPGMPPVLGLKEGSMLLVEGEKAILQGLTSAKLFQSGKEPELYQIGADLSFLLKK